MVAQPPPGELWLLSESHHTHSGPVSPWSRVSILTLTQCLPGPESLHPPSDPVSPWSRVTTHTLTQCLPGPVPTSLDLTPILHRLWLGVVVVSLFTKDDGDFTFYIIFGTSRRMGTATLLMVSPKHSELFWPPWQRQSVFRSKVMYQKLCYHPCLLHQDGMRAKPARTSS